MPDPLIPAPARPAEVVALLDPTPDPPAAAQAGPVAPAPVRDPWLANMQGALTHGNRDERRAAARVFLWRHRAAEWRARNPAGPRESVDPRCGYRMPPARWPVVTGGEPSSSVGPSPALFVGILRK